MALPFTESKSMDLRYMVVLEPEEEGGFSVSVPAFPEAHTQGESIEECLSNAREVIELVVTDRIAQGEDIPRPDAYTAIIERVAIPTPAQWKRVTPRLTG